MTTTDVEVFQFPATGREVRTILVDGEPWFVAADIAAALGYRDAHNAVRILRDDEKGTQPMSTPGGSQNITVISEPGMYRLVMRSNQPDAVEFQIWVSRDVLPAIRKTGRYESAPTPAPTFKLPATYAAALRELAATVEQRDEALAELAVAQPAADAWHTLASADGDFAVADAAKILSRDPNIKLGRDRLFTLLGEWGWTYRQQVDRRWRPKQSAIETGRLSELPSTHYHPRTGELINDPPQVRITFKGLGEIHLRLGGVKQLQIPAAAVSP